MNSKATFLKNVQELDQTLNKIIEVCDNKEYFVYDRDLVLQFQEFKSRYEAFLKSNKPNENSDLLSNLSRKFNENLNLIRLKRSIDEDKIKGPKVLFLLSQRKKELEEEKISWGSFNEIPLKQKRTKKLEPEKPNHRSCKSTDYSRQSSIVSHQRNLDVIKLAKEMMSEVLSLFNDDHKVDKPMKILDELAKLRANNLRDHSLVQFFDQLEKDNCSAIKSLKYQYEFINRLVEDANADDWIHETSKNNINVYYKIPKQNGESGGACALKFESELNISLLNLISIIYDSDLMHLWVPFCKIGKTLKKINKACKVFYNEMDLPFISNRELYSYGLGINRFEETGAIYIMSKTIDTDKEFLQEHQIEIPAKSKCVRMTVNYFAIEITPYSDCHCKVRFFTLLDPNLKIIPYSILNFITRKFAILIFQKIVSKASHDFERSPWFKSMKAPENRDFFVWCEREIQKIREKNEEIN